MTAEEIAREDLQRLVNPLHGEGGEKQRRNDKETEEDMPPLLQAVTRPAKYDHIIDKVNEKLIELEERERERQEQERYEKLMICK